MSLYKQVLLIAGAIILFLSSDCQELKPGDRVPDMEFDKAYNYSSSSLRFSDFEGKWIILDFWSIRCASCIKNFPKMDSLQKMFNDKIQIILVSEQSFDTAVNFFQKLKFKKPNLPIIASNPMMNKYFPHEGVPHLVWIDKEGRFYSATSGSSATVANIEKLTEGKNIGFKQRRPSREFDNSRPLIASTDSIVFNDLIGYSYLLPGKEQFFQAVSRQKINGSGCENRIILTRVSILNLYRTAYNEGSRNYFDYGNAVALEVKDSSKFLRPLDESLTDNWEEENLYSYDLLVPAPKAKQLYSIMQQDLERYFNIKASVEKRKVPCLVLTRITSDDLIATKGGKSYMAANRNDSVWQIRNIPFNSFVESMNRIFAGRHLETALVDQTGYKGNIDLSWSKDILDKFTPLNIEFFKNALNRYGLDLNIKETVTDVLVLRDN